MNEYNLQLIASLKIVWVGFFSYLYGLGGISNKWARRFVGAAWMMLGIFGFSMWQGVWNNWYLLCLPLMIIGLHIGYGENSKIRKFLTKLIYRK